jgi:hypothetical protein
VCHAVAAATDVAGIVYAARKEDIPDLGYPAPPDAADLAATMQHVLRAAAPEQIVHVPAEGAEAPFRRFLSGRTPR